MIVKQGRHLSQRVYPEMALIKPTLSNDALVLKAPNMKDLIVAFDPLPDQVVTC